jgi:sulfur relay (sulfurtransferase) DsrC/TusE family protein
MKPAPPTPRGPNRDEVIQLLRDYHRAHGTPPRVTAWQHARLTPGIKTIYRRFGSWPAALAAAGLPSPVDIRRTAPRR